MSTLVASIIVLGSIGILAAIILYMASRRFYVAENPKVEQIESALPGANCGACGFSGCHDFAVNFANADSPEGFNCPGAGAEGMKRVAAIMGFEAKAVRPMVAVLRCDGTCANRPTRAIYDGVRSCAVLSMVAVGSTDCAYGCLGCGDCVASCPWDAMHIDPTTGLPVIDQDKCVACGKCVDACPRSLIELRARGPRGLRVWVACANKDKGAIARKDCAAACIGCGKCLKACPHEAITIADNLAYIDYNKCKLCRKCAAGCPTGAIHTANFPTPIPPVKPTTDTQQ